ncbi:DUF5691 domain-containing protein [Sanguibacter antarcticus]|uniref:Uncharacterized protein n=1 Tax=Sanguibacter antarcticus TaxID=372484 RepID=A0A2A9E582_9MICO|nr:DUF5691 domain-containing protein [Sanguibacter antarcticus]PFG34207.1 hypothetical protein ATL42_2112 [Sanguibacter antarcticus]
MTVDLDDTLDPWDGLVTAALLGAARRPVDPSALPGIVGAAGARLPETDPAARLLDAAALMTAARRAALTPSRLPAPTTEDTTGADDATDVRRRRPASISPDDVAPPVSRAAARRLDDLLSGSRRDADALLVHWLRTAAQRGLRAPADRLPALLDWAARTTTPADLLPVLGERGRWLATHQKRWRRTLTVDDGPGTDSTDSTDATDGADLSTDAPVQAPSDQTWTHGTPHERQVWFRALRRAAPESARTALLALDWNRQDGETRLALVVALSQGLCLADEEVLDRALADRRKDVRAAAARLLVQIPDGRFQTQAAARALACIRVEHPPRPSLVARRPAPRIVVTLPDADDPTPWPAGMLETPRGTGARAWLLRHLVEAAPVRLWSQHTGLTPDALVALPVADDLSEEVHLGWAQAAVRDGDQTWARALAPTTFGSLYIDLLRLLPLEERVAHVVATLVADTVDGPSGRPAKAGSDEPTTGRRLIDASSALASVAGPWPAEMTAAVVRWLATSPAHGWDHGAITRQAARDLPDDAATEARVRAAAADVPPDNPRHQTILSLADTLLYRRQMIEELQ